MLRRAATGLLSRSPSSAAAAGGLRRFSTDLPSPPSSDEAFLSAWRRTVPNVDPPKTPLSFMQPRPPISSSIPSKLKINFVLPYASEFSNTEVDMVIVPATTGQMGILPGHVPSIAELKPGVMSVHEGNGVKQYFISSGFAFVHPNSVADIMAIEAVPVEQIDPSAVQRGLAEFTQKLSSATTDLQKAEAQIGLDVFSALNSAVTG